MHVEILDVVVIRLLVIMGAKSCETFIAEICFDWVYTSD
jgi:hypothetical protein